MIHGWHGLSFEKFNRHFNFHDADVPGIRVDVLDDTTTIEISITPSWCYNPLRVRLNDVIGFEFHNDCNFIQLYYASFRVENKFLILDLDTFGEIACHDCTILNMDEFIKGIPEHWLREL